MEINVITDEILRADKQFLIEVVKTPGQLREALRLRHQVYCVERVWLEGEDNEESDEFDSHSRHIILRHRSDGEVVGTVRLIAHNPDNPGDSFPMQRVCDPGLLQHLPWATTGEISRFALSKQRKVGRTDLMLLRLAILRGVVQVSSEMGLTHWLAVMERSLIRLHQTNEIHFDPVGPAVAYHGMRQPTIGVIETVLERIRAEQFPTWNFLTGGGTWFHPHDNIGAREKIRHAA